VWAHCSIFIVALIPAVFYKIAAHLQLDIDENLGLSWKPGSDGTKDSETEANFGK
jgi:hypothetical protein